MQVKQWHLSDFVKDLQVLSPRYAMHFHVGDLRSHEDNLVASVMSVLINKGEIGKRRSHSGVLSSCPLNIYHPERNKTYKIQCTLFSSSFQAWGRKKKSVVLLCIRQKENRDRDPALDGRGLLKDNYFQHCLHGDLTWCHQNTLPNYWISIPGFLALLSLFAFIFAGNKCV